MDGVQLPFPLCDAQVFPLAQLLGVYRADKHQEARDHINSQVKLN
jgi:hypothetical protein